MQSGPFNQQICQLQSELEATRKELAALVEARKRDAVRHHELVAIVGASRDAIWSWKLDGTISSWNAEAERLLQYKAEEIIGKCATFTTVCHAGENNNLVAPFELVGFARRERGARMVRIKRLQWASARQSALPEVCR
jgi:PAS domain S-box-containing protein